MNGFGDDMRFEVEEVPPHSQRQTSLEPSWLYASRIDSQRSVALSQSFPALDETPNDSMDYVWTEPQAIFPPETSLQCPAICASGSTMPPDHTSADTFSSFQQQNVSSPNQNGLTVLNQPFDQQQPAESLTRKRAPKAPTLSAKIWKPHMDRMKQLYVSEGKTIHELREIMNKELGITAT